MSGFGTGKGFRRNYYAITGGKLPDIEIERGGGRVITGLIGGPVADSYGNVLVPAGCVTDSLPVPLLLQHDPERALGVVTFAYVNTHGVHWRAQLAPVTTPGRVKDLLDDTWTKIQAGMLRAVSGAYHPLAWRERGADCVVSRWRLREISVCAVGANHTAKIATVRGENPPATDTRTQAERYVNEVLAREREARHSRGTIC